MSGVRLQKKGGDCGCIEARSLGRTGEGVRIVDATLFQQGGRSMPYRISRLGHVEVQSIDLDRDVDYYLNVIGLHQTGREGNTVYLKGWDERHAYSFSLTQAERPGMVRMAFRTVDPEDLDYYEKRLQTYGMKYDVIPEDYRRGRALRFQAPSGHTVELYYAMDYTGNLLPTVNPAPSPPYTIFLLN